ncbi:LPS export ABC transporter permease LptG [Rahnella woolbedingensis]|uniref:LPS export ABC transporter permease LptG n=1 Tax=Rahnella woolbedingensis TaxID=1510574 RepID=A0A419NB29_9GAMM|nr:LPS export ABC transporter permease LptG [Rahnella woolbedingensis]RJT45094.1 LPS export ABC transporter permease LptG [Rahnella woolbedingensis]
MNIFSRYLIRNIFTGFAAAAALLIPLFTTFDFINELDDVSSNGYRWELALLVVLMRLPRCLIDLSPFIALLGGIVGLGQLSKTLELTAMRVAGLSVFRISLVVLCSGLIMSSALSALDEWVASPLQQRALQIKDTAFARSDKTVPTMNALWARRDNEFVMVKTIDPDNHPVGIEIFRYNPDLSLMSYIYAENATPKNNGTWILHNVNQKSWASGQESGNSVVSLEWPSIFTNTHLNELTMPGDSFSVRQLNHFIRYLKNTSQPALEFELALWQKMGRPILVLAMLLLAVPFTFGNPRSPGLGSRLAIGVIVGLFTYIMDQIIVNLGLLLSLNAVLTAIAPPSFILALAFVLIHRFNKQQ